MELSKDDSILLIQEYEKHPVLWDQKNEFYFNKNKKADAWADIAKCFNIDEKDAKKKINSLLGSFRREKAKGKKWIGTGKTAVEVYRSEWFAFKSFGFLMDRKEPNNTLSSESMNGEDIQPAEEYCEQVPGGGDEAGNSADIPVNGAVYVNNTDDVAAVSFQKPSMHTHKRARETKNAEEKEDLRIQKPFKFVLRPIEPDDSAMKFAKYLADKLNQFDGRTKAILTHKINELIFEYEMKLFSNPSHTSGTSYSATHTYTHPEPKVSPHSGTSHSLESSSTTSTPVYVDIASASLSPVQSPAPSVSPYPSPSPQSSWPPSPDKKLSPPPTDKMNRFLQLSHQ